MFDAVENKAAQEVVGSVVQKEVYFATGIGVTFEDGNSIANNEAVLNFMELAPEGDVTRQDGYTSFSVNAIQLGHFLHMTYCSCPEEAKVQVDFDGIHTFEALDDTGTLQKFNAQLITIRETPVR
jgi:hypothetical protein